MRITRETTITATMTGEEHRELVGFLRDFKLDQERLSFGGEIIKATPEYLQKLNVAIDRWTAL